jgi:tetratricopeptide (TPR) repeat protein
VAKYNKKRARELRHDRFRDSAMVVFERFGDQLEGKGRTILYVLGGIVVVGVLSLVFVKWSNRKSDEARRAMGRAITIATTPISTAAVPAPDGPSFKSEQERAQKAVEEFHKVAAKYGEPYRGQAQYLAATNQLTLDRAKGIAELREASKSSNSDVAALSKFALAQALEADGKYDEAVQLYTGLVSSGGQIVTPDTANFRLALVYSKQGKKKEASDILFKIVDTSRKAKGSDQLPVAPSGAANEAAKELQKLDPDRYAQLPPEAPPLG